MRLKLLMVKLIPDHDMICKEKSFFSKEIIFYKQDEYAKDLYLGLENSNKCFITRSHFKPEGDSFYIPAFQIVELDEKESSKDFTIKYSPKKETTMAEFYYDEKYDIFYDLPKVKVEGNSWTYCNHVENATLGVTNAGVFYLDIYRRETNEKINFVPYKVCVLPSSMSVKDYEDMINDLLYIKYELLLEDQKGAKQSLSLKWIKSLEEIQRLVRQIKNPLLAINKKPKVRLNQVPGKVMVKNIRKFNSRVLMDMALSSGTSKCNTLVQLEDTNIYENQMLLYSLKSLKDYVNKFGKYVKDKYEMKMKAIEMEKEKIERFHKVDKVEDLIDKLDSMNRRNKDDVREQAIMIVNKYKSIFDEKYQIESNNYVEEITKELDKLISLDLFKGVSKRKSPWRLTQIFINDSNYSKLYRLLRGLDRKLEFSFDFNSVDIIQKKADRLYEYWLLIKILYILTVEQQWVLEGGKDIPTLIKSILKDKESYELENEKFNLIHAGPRGKGIIKMDIYYNKKFDNGKVPDFAFNISVYDESDLKAEKWFFLDAKYRNYEEMHDYHWFYDINTTAIRKYINDFEDTNIQVTASFIVHTDSREKYVYFGGFFDRYLADGFTEWADDNPGHRFGSFYFLPNKSHHFLTFTKLMLEYHFVEQDLWKICWECGSLDTEIISKDTSGGYEKYHIKCKDCSSFWVRTHCRKCWKKLVKHAMNNYHKETKEGDPWYVKCPVCDYKE